MVNWWVMKWATQKHGFTIVELLIVIVVIAILAAITVAAYNGITHRTKVSATEGALSQVAKKIETYKVEKGTYPTSLTDINYKGDPNVALAYRYNSTAGSFCLDGRYGDIEYSVRTKQLNPVEGRCIDNGLELWVPMNGSANDVSGGNTTFTISGSPTSTTGADGRANGAYVFDGDDYGTASNPTTLPQDMTQFSVSIWARSNYVSDYQYFVHRGNGTGIGTSAIWLGTNSGGNISASVDGNFTTGTTGVIANDNAWHHLVLVYGGGRQVGYLDGAERFNVVVGPVTNNITTNTFTIGAGPGSYRPLRGALDDLRIYRRAITQDEVTALFNQGAQ